MEAYNYFLVFIIGACIGSFLNVVIYRVPLNKSIITPRSHCINCNTTIPFYHNIPIFSYLYLKGKCKYCKQPFSISYFFVEIVTSMVFVSIYYKFGVSNTTIFYWIYFSLLIVLSFIDFKYKAVPSTLLMLTFLSSFLLSSDIITSLKNGVILAGSIYLLNYILTFYIQNIKAKITKNKDLENQEALGEGDIPIFATFGIILAIPSAFCAVLLAACFALLPSIFTMILKKDIQTPFIPYLSLGIFVEILFDISSRI